MSVCIRCRIWSKYINQRAVNQGKWNYRFSLNWIPNYGFSFKLSTWRNLLGQYQTMTTPFGWRFAGREAKLDRKELKHQRRSHHPPNGVIGRDSFNGCPTRMLPPQRVLLQYQSMLRMWYQRKKPSSQNPTTPGHWIQRWMSLCPDSDQVEKGNHPVRWPMTTWENLIPRVCQWMLWKSQDHHRRQIWCQL